MMRWYPTDTTAASEREIKGLDVPASGSAAKDGGRSAVQYLLGAVLDAVWRLGPRSLALAAVVAVLVAALLLGLSVGEASAAVTWCPRC